MQSTHVKSRSAVSGAADILRDVFGDMDHGLRFRMWDGTTISVGREVLPLEITFPSLDSFKHILLNPTADAFAEAYCNSVIEFEGDLFEAMKVADSFENIELTAMQKFKLALRIWKLSE
ncbi:MAG: hypothetical protein OXE44_09580 [Nitrospinae bacterium]|nr:hypothetical protein [Nitrospinota bacterium]